MSRDTLGPLEVELRMVVGYHVGARILGATYHLCKKSKCSQELSCVSGCKSEP